MIVRKSSVIYFALGFCLIALGLASRKVSWLFPTMLGKYPGDALWALMVFCFVRALASSWSTFRVTAFVVGICFLVEFQQLYQASWIVSIRNTFFGHLVLGSHFSEYDLLAYVVGGAIGFSAEWLLRLSIKRNN